MAQAPGHLAGHASCHTGMALLGPRPTAFHSIPKRVGFTFTHSDLGQLELGLGLESFIGWLAQCFKSVVERYCMHLPGDNYHKFTDTGTLHL
jgi:hypothetical protein